MPRNLIATCGTSQIEQRRLQKAMGVALTGIPDKERQNEQRKWQELLNYVAKKMHESAEADIEQVG